VNGDASWKCDGSDMCAEFAGGTSTDFSRTYEGDPQTRVLEETARFAVAVDISPLIEGHLLVAPKDHYLNFSQAMQDSPHEAIDIVEKARDWVQATYGWVALFEHGSTADRAGGACIDHAHVHVLPVGAEALVDVMRRDRLELDELPSLACWVKLADTSRPYLLCSNGETLHVAFPQRSARRQYLRSAAAQVLGIPDPEWDWALIIRKSLLRETILRYRA
jgi:diadenosine tetraphosphate (Ap4A) HIT family hydrolase